MGLGHEAEFPFDDTLPEPDHTSFGCRKPTGYEIGTVRRLFAERNAEIARLKGLSVTRILLAVVPGDGNGLEVYAKSVEDVETKMSELAMRAEDAELKRAALLNQVATLRAEVSASLKALQLIADAHHMPLALEYVQGIARAAIAKAHAARAAGE